MLIYRVLLNGRVIEWVCKEILSNCGIDIDEYAFVIDQCLNVNYGQIYNHSKVECTDDGAKISIYNDSQCIMTWYGGCYELYID